MEAALQTIPKIMVLGDGDLVRSERWGVREQMEVDFGLIGLILGLRKTKEKI